MPQRFLRSFATASFGLLPTLVFAQQSQPTGTGPKLTTDSLTVDVQLYSPDIVGGSSSLKARLVLLRAGELFYG